MVSETRLTQERAGGILMGDAQTVDHCIRHEGKYRNVGVYVVVVMDGDCPVEVGVSPFFPLSYTGIEKMSIQGKFRDLEEIANAWLSCGGPLAGLLRFLYRPPFEMSGILGDALIAALEG